MFIYGVSAGETPVYLTMHRCMSWLFHGTRNESQRICGCLYLAATHQRAAVYVCVKHSDNLQYNMYGESIVLTSLL